MKNIFLVSMLLRIAGCLDNGLALYPPMGWLSGQRFECNMDCINYPDDCISERLVKTTVDALVTGGYPALGYKYVGLGDCWQAAQRDAQGQLQPDAQRFPSGIKALADYVHSHGLKFGLYIDLGNSSSHGQLGSMGHLQKDAHTLAAWGVDMVTANASNISNGKYYNTAFPEFGQHLNATGRPVLYRCYWPWLLQQKRIQVDYARMGQVCNTFITHAVSRNIWESLEKELKFYGDVAHRISNHTGPHQWNDPNQLLVGDYGLSIGQQRMQVAIWAMMSSPWFVSADIRHMDAAARDLLQNKAAIAIGRDPLGTMGYQVTVRGQVYIWRRPISPKGSFALALFYINVSGFPTKVTVKLSDLGLTTAAAYNFTEVYSGQQIGTFKPWYIWNCEIDPTGVLFVHALAVL